MGKIAFTLSEVLLTISIIGIVASLTMPGLISNYKGKVYVTQMEKSISQFEQAMQNIMARHECTDIVCAGTFNGDVNDAGWNNQFEKEILKAIKIVKIAKNGTAMASHIKSMPLKPKTVFAEQVDWRSTEGFKFMTPDGAMYLITPQNCIDVPNPDLSTLKNICAELTIDVNSESYPNQYGRDLFKFVVGQNGHLYTLYGRDYANAVSGSTSGTNYWKTNDSLCAGDGLIKDAPANVSGYGCAARIMEDGWKMTY